MSSINKSVLSALSLFSAAAIKAEQTTIRIKGEKAKAQLAMYTVLTSEFGANWHTLTKGMASKGIKFASEVEQCRIALHSMQQAANAGNPDSAWNELKRAYVTSLTAAETAGESESTKETRSERRSKDQVFRDALVSWMAECSRTVVRPREQTDAQRNGMGKAAELLKLLANVPASPKKA